jgi:hypothetical protein
MDFTISATTDKVIGGRKYHKILYPNTILQHFSPGKQNITKENANTFNKQ